jgi:hypothetical protein
MKKKLGKRLFPGFRKKFYFLNCPMDERTLVRYIFEPIELSTKNVNKKP